jgi:cyclic beta-1,2-glucan synthetase
LFEGTFARAGLASDIEVLEEFPSRYDVATSRQHRWARGDWQLLPWIFRRSGSAVPPIGRWKMLDNLRRSLSAPASVAALVAGWTLPLQAAAVWSGFIVSTIALTHLLPCIRRDRAAARAHHGAQPPARARSGCLARGFADLRCWSYSSRITRG